MRYRIEKDSISEKQVPAEAYYGIQTLRAKENFQITKRGICRQMIKALAIVKKAAAKANLDAQLLKPNIANAIMLSCDEILNGRLHGQFVTDLIQGGAGTSMNMNANEVIANRANEMLGGSRGTYEHVHPIDHVNMGQSTNDVIPTSGKLALIKQIKKTIQELKKLNNSYLTKSIEFKDILIMGRTHLQEALPLKLGQQFKAFSTSALRNIKRLEQTIDSLSEVNMGATAIGTGVNANIKYTKKIILHLNKFSGEEFRLSKDMIDSTRNLDSFALASSSFKLLAIDLSKTANDLRLLSSSIFDGKPELILPTIQPGSSIMPGKFNPVVPEMVNQVCFYCMGLDVTITKAVEAGQLELNVFEPIILMSLFEEVTSIRRAIRCLRELCIENISANSSLDKTFVKHSITTITLLSPYLGYDLSCEIINEANKTGMSVSDIVTKKGLMTAEQIDQLLNATIASNDPNDIEGD